MNMVRTTAYTAMTMADPASPAERSLALLATLRLASPALPVGAFAYSQGLEYAVEAGWLRNARDTEDWLHGVLNQALARLDIPVLARLHRSVARPTEFQRWNRYLLAARETRELRFEERQLGRALRQLLLKLGLPVPDDEDGGWLAMFAWCGHQWHMSEEDTCLAYAWAWLENQLSAAAKTVPVGQTDVQGILGRAMPQLVCACTLGRSLGDDAITGGLPGLAMASMLHERQYSRLFRS